MTEQTPDTETAAKEAAWAQAAEAQEQYEAIQANVQHLQRRAVALNVEVRIRDERIAHLESELAVLRSQADDALRDAEEAGPEPDAD